MTLIHHINLIDSNQQIYCCLRNKVVVLNEQQKDHFCGGCKMLVNDVEKVGVTCMWDDLRDVSDPYFAINPQAEWNSNQARKVIQPQPLLSEWDGEEEHTDLAL